MSNGRTISTPIESNIVTKSLFKDFLALIKIGIVNSNLITTFTGLFLAFQFTGKSFLHNHRFARVCAFWICLDCCWFCST